MRSRRTVPACKENPKGELFPSWWWTSKVESYSSHRRSSELRPQKMALLINVSNSNYFKLDHAGLSHRCPELIGCYSKWFCGGGFNLRNSRGCCHKNICDVMLRYWKRIYLTITSNPVVYILSVLILISFFSEFKQENIFTSVFLGGGCGFLFVCLFCMTTDWNCSEFIYVFSMVRNWTGSLVQIL